VPGADLGRLATGNVERNGDIVGIKGVLGSLRSRRWLGVPAVLTAVALLGAACSSSSSSSSAHSTSTKAAGSASGPVTITFWSAMSGSLGKTLGHLVDEFNSSQSHYKVDLIYRGSYPEVLADTIAAFKAHNAPNIAQIFDAGTATVMDSSGVYVPVHTLMKEYGYQFSTSDFIGGAASYYETASDQLDSEPFNSSTPVLYYNKAELSQAGITSPPRTWDEVASDAAQLAAHGVGCALTSSGAYVMWTDIEQYAVWNDVPYATEDNGYEGIQGVKLELDTQPFIQHWDLLGQLAQKGEYRWEGLTTSTVPLFTGGTCAMYEQSSADLTTILSGAKFPVGVAELPYDSSQPGAPQNTVVGGASLWVLAGAPKDTYAADAAFLHFMMSPQAQAYWAENTGYVPVTNAAAALLKSQGFYASHPADEVAVAELTNKPPTPQTRGIRLGYLPEIRDAEASAIAQILSGKESAAQALAQAQARGDQILSQFASQYGS
jgi:sn-glycerol 3-phosphate transport system substrate-binding protein